MLRNLFDKLLGRPAIHWSQRLPLEKPLEINLADQALEGLDPAGPRCFFVRDRSAPIKAALSIFPETSSVLIDHSPRSSQRSLLCGLLFPSAGLQPVQTEVVIKSKTQTWNGFVIAGGEKAADDSMRQRLRDRIRELTSENVIAISPATDSGVDALQFAGEIPFLPGIVLRDYTRYLDEIVGNAAADTHFGNLDKRGRKFLYQSVPGSTFRAKRDIEERFALLSELMRRMGVTLLDRLILDVGCNLGMFMGQYLRHGALWCHGWDQAGVTVHSERVLRAIGCNRLSLTGSELTVDRPLEKDLPAPVQSHLPGCVISYLAIRGHLGWARSLETIPWSFLLYESHKWEDEATLNSAFDDLAKTVSFERGPVLRCKSDRSRARSVTILKRKD